MHSPRIFYGFTIATLCTHGNTERFGFDFLNRSPELVAEARAFLNTNTLPRHLQFLERLMAASTTGWIANTPQPSIADFVLVPRLQWLVSGQHEGIDRDLISKHAPLVAGMITRFNELPQIVAYYHPDMVAARA